MMTTIVFTHADLARAAAHAGAAASLMRVTITKRPHCTIQGMHFTAWRVGETYDVSFEIASLLIVEGCAQLEMRAGADRRREKRWGEAERRQRRAG